MVRRARPKPPALTFLSALLIIGGLTLGLGVQKLLELKSFYREEDIAYSETPQTFRLWFLRVRQGGTSHQDLVKAVSGRLMVMRLEQRRALTHALMADDYLETFWTQPRERRGTVAVLLQGLLKTLSSSPMNGDLWLVAARLQRRLNGFDETAARYLNASFRFAPNEVHVALDRVLFASQVSVLLTAELKEMAQRDERMLRSSTDRRVVKWYEETVRRGDSTTQ